MMTTVVEIEKCLPQTQCGLCGYAGCKPYAEAILQGEAINLCPPGALATLQQLAQVTKRPVTLAMQQALQARITPPRIAYIRPEECIGCTKCIQACPVDAIIGAAKQLHVVVQNECTGCTLCVDPCPVDCIDLLPVAKFNYQKQQAQVRYQAKLQRGAFKRPAKWLVDDAVKLTDMPDKKAFILAAVARAKAKKQRPADDA